MTTIENLIQAKELISDEHHWCQGSARRLKSDGTFARCASAALEEVLGYWDLNSLPECIELCKTLDSYPYRDNYAYSVREMALISRVISYNDSTDHPYVMKLFNDTIERLRHDLSGVPGSTELGGIPSG